MVNRIFWHFQGMVEKWLLQVEDVMISSVRKVIMDSQLSYPSIPRNQWVLQWPGQVVLCVSCMFWTTEVSEAMQKEGGNGLAVRVYTLLAHLSTTCSGWAIVIDPCPSVCLSVNNYLKSSPLKPANRFQWNFTEMILGWCTFRILQRYEFHEELWLAWQPKEKKLKIFLSQTVRARAFIFGI